MSAISGVLAAGFAFLTAMGWRRKRMDWLLAGLWGCIAALQTGWGILQFSRYQRAGWQLLIVVALGGAMLAALPAWARRAPVQRARAAAVALLTLAAFALPPHHRPLHSAAESTLVDFMRAIPRHMLPARGYAVRRVLDEPEWPAVFTLQDDRAINVLSRRYTGFTRGQGDPVYAALGARIGIAMHPLGRGVLLEPHPLRQHLVVYDEPAVTSTAQLGFAARLDAALAGASLAVSATAEEARREADAFLVRVEAAGWRLERVTLAPTLEVVLATPP